MSGKRLRQVGLLVLFALFVWGAIGVVQRLTAGHAGANYGSYVPWGLWVSAYIYFVGLSAGAFLLSSLVYVFRIERLARLARPALLTAAITLVMALVCILFDLGHMGRFYEVFTRPNFSSLMAWMIWLYTAYFLLILAELWIEMRVDLSILARSGGPLARIFRVMVMTLGWRPPNSPDEIAAARTRGKQLLRVLGGFGIPVAIAFHGGVGALFAGLLARPYWHSSLYPILFLTGALLSGGGLLLAVLAFGDQGKGTEGETALRLLARAVLGLLVLDLIVEWAEISIPAWYRVGEGYMLLKTVLFGEYWYVFWIFHLLLGALIPLYLLAKRSPSRTSAGVAGALIAVTFMAVRLNIVVPGQITPQLRGLEESYIDSRLLFTYQPSAFEWSIVAFVVALGTAFYLLANRYLPVAGSRGEASRGLRSANHG